MENTNINPLVLESEVIDVLHSCFDPEIPVNIYELGLVYNVKVDPLGKVEIQMTLTSPNCPVAEDLPLEIEAKVKAIPGVTGSRVEIVFEPPWDPAMMSEAAKLELGML